MNPELLLLLLLLLVLAKEQCCGGELLMAEGAAELRALQLAPKKTCEIWG